MKRTRTLPRGFEPYQFLHHYVTKRKSLGRPHHPAEIGAVLLATELVILNVKRSDSVCLIRALRHTAPLRL